MLIPIGRFLSLIAFLTIGFSFSASAAEERPLPSVVSEFKGIKNFLFDDPISKPFLMPSRPQYTDAPAMSRHSDISTVQEDGKNLNACLETLPYDHHSMIERVGQAARVMVNHTAAPIEQFTIQPFFSGLKGPKLTLMRRDLERALVYHQGSANEIYHNSVITSDPRAILCRTKDRFQWDAEIRTHIDVFESNHAPLYRSDLILNGRIHLTRHFMGSLGLRNRLHDNLIDDPNLRILDRFDPIRQDVFGYAQNRQGIDHAMISGFATPAPDFYIAGHGGFLEEMFFGLGGEVLYRPYDSVLAIGAEAWATTKRIPFDGAWNTLDNGNRQTSALLNLWYDMPRYPLQFGASYGQFLDGDVGGQFKARYTPAPGWQIEGFATLTNQDDRTLDNNDDTKLFAGLKLTMPLGNLAALPDNSRMSVDFKPFARDKGQRIETPYSLYDLTDPWHTNTIYRYWDDLTTE